MKKLIIVLLLTVLGSTTVLSQSKNYGPLYSDVMYCMMSGWIGSKGKKMILLMNGVYEFQRGYEGGWRDVRSESEKILKSKLKDANQNFKNKVFGDIDGLINKRGKKAFRKFGSGFGVYESLNQRKIKGLTGFEEYSKQICDKLGISPTTVVSNSDENSKFILAISKIVAVKTECMIKNADPRVIKVFASKLDKLEIECGKKCKGKGWFKLFSEKEMKIIGTLEPVLDKCQK